MTTDPVSGLADLFSDPKPPEATLPGPVQLPPDTPVEDPEDLVTEKAKNAWQELKNREKASRRAAMELQAQIEEMKKTAATVAEERVKFAEELKARDDHNKQLEEELGKLTLEHQPEFRQKYDAPIDELASRVVSTLKAATDVTDPKQLDDIAGTLMTTSDDNFTHMVSKLSAPVQGSLLNFRNEFAELTAARNHAIEEWRATQAGVIETDAQDRIVERAARRRDMAEQAIEFTKATTPPDKRLPILSEPEYARDIEAVDAAFRGFMQEAKDEAIARAAYQGYLMPVVMRQVAHLAEALQQWQQAYYTVQGVRSPPAMPMRVQANRAAQPPPPPAPVIEPGRNFNDTVENTVAATLRRAGIV